MRVTSLFVLGLLGFFLASARAETVGASAPGDDVIEDFPYNIFAQPESEKAEMDIHPSLYQEFWKNWHFVTVRWRQDIHQFRFTFANDLAWKTMSEHRTDYPVGAMFGKLIYPSEEDLALPVSVLPSSKLSRLEVVLWDPNNKKASSDGWVYLRFANPDPSIPRDKDSVGKGIMSQKEIDSCVECHQRVYDRGFIFSQPAYLFREHNRNDKDSETGILSNRFSDSMKVMTVDEVPRIARDLINTIPAWNNRTLKGYEGNFFFSSLGELRPVLANMAEADTASIYMVYDRDDPNVIEIASSIERHGHDHCAAVVYLSGATINSAYSKSAEHGAPGGPVQDLTQQYKPSAGLYTMCGADPIDVLPLPLLYKVEDKDGFPSYYFAPPKFD